MTPGHGPLTDKHKRLGPLTRKPDYANITGLNEALV